MLRFQEVLVVVGMVLLAEPGSGVGSLQCLYPRPVPEERGVEASPPVGALLVRLPKRLAGLYYVAAGLQALLVAQSQVSLLPMGAVAFHLSMTYPIFPRSMRALVFRR